MLLDKPIDEAIGLCVKNWWPYRIVREDGVPRVVTRDLQLDRLNFTVDAGIVTHITYG